MLEGLNKTDQAHGLRTLKKRRPVKVIAVSGGKGGVGKTNVCANLAVAMAALGRKVMVLDADMGLANIDVIYGLQPRATLADAVGVARLLEREAAALAK